MLNKSAFKMPPLKCGTSKTTFLGTPPTPALLKAKLPAPDPDPVGPDSKWKNPGSPPPINEDPPEKGLGPVPPLENAFPLPLVKVKPLEVPSALLKF